MPFCLSDTSADIQVDKFSKEISIHMSKQVQIDTADKTGKDRNRQRN